MVTNFMMVKMVVAMVVLMVCGLSQMELVTELGAAVSERKIFLHTS
jgi:hypothetical protein